MVKRSGQLQKTGKIVVFTNGCFDILHRGHIELLRLAKKEGDYLFVAVNGDESVRRLKGENRPIQAAEDRAIILNALACVDDVTLFHEDTPLELISKVRPNVLVKGEDYEESEMVGGELVKSWGGRTVRVPLVENRATQQILDKIAAG